ASASPCRSSRGRPPRPRPPTPSPRCTSSGSGSPEETAMKEWNTGLMAHLGMRFVEVGPDKVVAELDVRAELATVGGAVHGGTLMALADTVGAAGAPAVGLRTPTLQAKTHFFAAPPPGAVRPPSPAPPQGQPPP